MKVTHTREIAYSDVDAAFRLKQSAVCRYFQEAAARHAALAGDRMVEARRRGTVWAFHKLAARVHAAPAFGDRVEVVTWSRGVTEFKAFREFEIRAAAGGLLVAGTSVWAYVDVVRGRIVRVPENVGETYTHEPDRALDFDVDAWRGDARFPPAASVALSTRSGDFDTNGHMNNSVYLDLAETAWRRGGAAAPGPATASAAGPAVTGWRIQFQRGVEPAVDAVTVHLGAPAAAGLPFNFRIESAGQANACGELHIG